MFKKFSLLGALAMIAGAMLTSGCGGSGSTAATTYDPYYNGYVDVVVYDPYNPYYDPYYDPYCTYCYSDDGSMTNHDLSKLSAKRQAEVIQHSTDKLQANFGLSAERSEQLAKLAFQMAKTPKASLTEADYNNFAVEILGSSAADVKSAYLQDAAGDHAKMDQLIDRAAEVNGIGPEHAREIMKMLN